MWVWVCVLAWTWVNVCVQVCVRVCARVQVQVQVRVCVLMCVCTCAGAGACMHACACIANNSVRFVLLYDLHLVLVAVHVSGISDAAAYVEIMEVLWKYVVVLLLLVLLLLVVLVLVLVLVVLVLVLVLLVLVVLVVVMQIFITLTTAKLTTCGAARVRTLRSGDQRRICWSACSMSSITCHRHRCVRVGATGMSLQMRARVCVCVPVCLRVRARALFNVIHHLSRACV